MVNYLLSNYSSNEVIDLLKDLSLENVFMCNHLEMFKFLVKRGYPIDSKKLLKYISDYKHNDIYSWLYDNYPSIF